MGTEATTIDELRQDRLSQLPAEIIHTILYSLDSPKTAAATSLLSKTWLKIWRSYPVLEFYTWEFENNDRYSGIAETKLAQFLRALPDGQFVPALHAFRIYISINPYGDHHVKNIDELLSFLTANALFPSEFDFAALDPYDRGGYTLPEGAFSNWTRSKLLKLCGCSFVDKIIGVNLAMLEVLHLKSVKIGKETLESFLANAPLLRTLKLVKIDKVERIAIVSAPRLKTLIVRSLESLVEIELATTATELETLDVADVAKFELTGLPLFLAAPNIKVLNVGSRECPFTLAELAGLIHESLSLESVFLGPKRKPRSRQNQNQNQNLMDDGYNLQDVNIDGLLINGFKVSNRASEAKCIVDLNMYWDDFKAEWFVRLRRFFSTIYSQSRRVTFKLSYLYLKSDKVPWKLKKEAENASLLPPPSIHLMELGVAYVWDMKTAKAFVDGLLWMCRPEFVLINSDEISEERCWELMSRDHVSNCCCKGARMLCWRHDAKDVKRINGTVEMREMAAEEAGISPQGYHCFRLTWC